MLNSPVKVSLTLIKHVLVKVTSFPIPLSVAGTLPASIKVLI
jgi:hypothetical protein